MHRDALVQGFGFGLLERTKQQFAHSLAEVSTKEGVQQRIDARVEVRHQEGERREQGVEVRIALVVRGPGREEEIIVNNQKVVCTCVN